MTLRVVNGGDNEPVKRGPGRPSGEGFDPWQTEGLEYSIDKFYTRSTNKHDHSLRMEVRVPPHIYAEAKELIESKHFPSLRSLGDLLRDALIHRLKYLSLDYTSAELEAALDFEMREVRTASRDAEIDKMSKMIENHRSVLEKAAKLRDAQALRNELADMEDNAFIVREPYASMLNELIKQHTLTLQSIEAGLPNEPSPDI